jgi:hypothetical protein
MQTRKEEERMPERTRKTVAVPEFTKFWAQWLACLDILSAGLSGGTGNQGQYGIAVCITPLQANQDARGEKKY